MLFFALFVFLTQTITPQTVDISVVILYTVAKLKPHLWEIVPEYCLNHCPLKGRGDANIIFPLACKTNPTNPYPDLCATLL